MKKLIFTGLAIASLTAGIAQGLLPVPKGEQALLSSSTGIKKSFGKATVAGWYQPLTFAQASNIGGSLQISAFFLSNDSLFKVVRDDGSLDGPSFLSMGHTLDPKDDAIDLTQSPELKLTRFSTYSVDSVGFRYLYVRNVDSVDDGLGGKSPVVDTLFITYYRGNQIQRTNFTGGAQDKVSVIDWNNTRRFPTNFTTTDTFLLTPENNVLDTTVASNASGGFENSFATKFATFKAPNNFNVAANELSGFALTFRSGVPAVIGTDTAIIVWQQDPATFTGRRANYMGAFYWYNEKATGTPWSNPTYYNSHQFQPVWNGYLSAGNWAQNYVVGSAFVADLFLDNAMHLTSLNASTKDLKNAAFGMTNVYPNPASINGTALVGLNFKQAGTATIAIYNIAGQLVKTIAPQSFIAGEQAMEIDLAGLNAGVYMVTVTVNGESQTKRLTIAE